MRFVRSCAFCGFALVMAAISSLSANAETRLASSPTLQVELLADEPGWCGAELTLRVTAIDTRTFASIDFLDFINGPGILAVARQCSVAQTVHFRGFAGRAPEPVWSGSAAAATHWMLQPDTSAFARASAAKTSTSFIGEWTGDIGCLPDQHKPITVSFYASDDHHALAYVQVNNERPTRFAAEGSFDPGSGQFLLQSNTIIRRGSDISIDLAGQFEAPGRIFLQHVCGGFTPIVLAHASDIPLLAYRIRDDEHRRAALIAGQTTHPAQIRPVGTIQPGTPREPSCDELIAWSESHLIDVRLKLYRDDGGGILLQFTDEESSRVFGTAAYYWFKTNEAGQVGTVISPGQIVGKACDGRQRDPRVKELSQIARDVWSIHGVYRRVEIDEAVRDIAVRLATSGGSPAEMDADVASLLSSEAADAFERDSGITFKELTTADRAALVENAKQMRAMLAERMAQETRATTESRATAGADPR